MEKLTFKEFVEENNGFSFEEEQKANTDIYNEIKEKKSFINIDYSKEQFLKMLKQITRRLSHKKYVRSDAGKAKRKQYR